MYVRAVSCDLPPSPVCSWEQECCRCRAPLRVDGPLRWCFCWEAAGTSYPASFSFGLGVFLSSCLSVHLCIWELWLEEFVLGKRAPGKLENRRSVLRIGLHDLFINILSILFMGICEPGHICGKPRMTDRINFSSFTVWIKLRPPGLHGKHFINWFISLIVFKFKKKKKPLLRQGLYIVFLALICRPGWLNS